MAASPLLAAQVRLTADEVARLDAHRGATSRAQALRELVRALPPARTDEQLLAEGRAEAARNQLDPAQVRVVDWRDSQGVRRAALWIAADGQGAILLVDGSE